MTQAAVEVHDNPERHRYEATVDGKTGIVNYRLKDDAIVFTHTEVPKELKGQGVASALARFALEDARRRGLAVVPLCPFVAGYIRRHPEYTPLVRGA